MRRAFQLMKTRSRSMSHVRRGWGPILAAALALSGTAIPAFAAEPPAAATDAKPAQPSAEVAGFRSARFGMTADEVAKAIVKDFRVKDGDIKRETNPTERTTSLIARVDDQQLGIGPSIAAYIFGHRSHRLMQVNVMWGGGVNPKVEPAALVGAANSLRDYFLRQGYEPEGLMVNQPVGDGSQMVIFRGADKQGRMTLLTLSIPPKPKDEKVPQAPPSLNLSYIEKPGDPDVFRIEKGY